MSRPVRALENWIMDNADELSPEELDAFALCVATMTSVDAR